MKKLAVLLISALLVTTLCSCRTECDPYTLLSDFTQLYGAEGIIYHTSAEIYEDGYIDADLFRRIFVFSGEMPDSFAVFLNSHSHKGSECGVFVFSDEYEKSRIVEACQSRAALVSDNGDYLIICSSNTVFYSTLEDKPLAERLWNQIIRRCY